MARKTVGYIVEHNHYGARAQQPYEGGLALVAGGGFDRRYATVFPTRKHAKIAIEKDECAKRFPGAAKDEYSIVRLVSA